MHIYRHSSVICVKAPYFYNFFFASFFFLVQLTEGVTYDAWFDVTEGNDHRRISFLKSLYNHSAFVSNQPDSQGILPSFQSPRDIADHYGIRMTTYYIVRTLSWDLAYAWGK